MRQQFLIGGIHRIAMDPQLARQRPRAGQPRPGLQASAGDVTGDRLGNREEQRTVVAPLDLEGKKLAHVENRPISIIHTGTFE